MTTIGFDMTLPGNAFILLRNVAIALNHAAAHHLPLSPSESARLACDAEDARHEIMAAMTGAGDVQGFRRRTEAEITWLADARNRCVEIPVAPGGNVIPARFGRLPGSNWMKQESP